MSTLRSFCSSAFGVGENICGIVSDTIATASSGLTFCNREVAETMRQQAVRIKVNTEVADKEIKLNAAERENALMKRIARLDTKLIKKYEI